MPEADRVATRTAVTAPSSNVRCGAIRAALSGDTDRARAKGTRSEGGRRSTPARSRRGPPCSRSDRVSTTSSRIAAALGRIAARKASRLPCSDSGSVRQQESFYVFVGVDRSLVAEAVEVVTDERVVRCEVALATARDDLAAIVDDERRVVDSAIGPSSGSAKRPIRSRCTRGSTSEEVALVSLSRTVDSRWNR